MSRTQLCLVALALAGCAGPRPPTPAPAMAYTAPAAPSTYAVTDTVHYVIEAGDMGRVETGSGYTGTVRLVFEPDSGAYRVTAAVLDFAGTFSNPMTGSVDADESGAHGPFVLRVSPIGRIELTQTPTLSDAFQQVTSADALLRNFFVRVPGRPVHAGDTWVDTLDHQEKSTQVTTDSRSIMTATVAGDTIVDGRTLLLVRTEYANTVHLSGNSGGTEVVQKLEGGTSGTFLWDVERHLLAERTEHGQLDGTLDLPAMGVTDLPVHAAVHRHVRLLPAVPD